MFQLVWSGPSYGVVLELNDWPEWHRLEASAARWIEAHNLQLDAETIRAEKKLIYERLVGQKLRLKPGAKLLVEVLSGRCRLCVASGSRPESIRACLDKFSLTSHLKGFSLRPCYRVKNLIRMFTCMRSKLWEWGIQTQLQLKILWVD